MILPLVGAILDTFSKYLTKAIYDTDNDGIVDHAETVVFTCRNSSGTTIPKGSAVYINGAIGQRPTIILAKADVEATSSKTLGVTDAAILNHSQGPVVLIGKIAELDTSAFTDGATLWLSSTVAGALVTTPPATPAHAVFIGYCAYAHNNHGILAINVQNGYEINELHDVHCPTPADQDVIRFSSALGYWVNDPLNDKEETGVAATLDAAHVAATDPHTQYIKETEKAAANGVATLDAGYTYSGHPVGCAAGLAALAETRRLKLDENAAARGKDLAQALAALKAKHPLVGDVRGKGLMAALELVADRDSKKPADKKTMSKVADSAYEAGVMLRVSGNNLILSPPLILTALDVKAIAEGIDAGLSAAG